MALAVCRYIYQIYLVDIRFAGGATCLSMRSGADRPSSPAIGRASGPQVVSLCFRGASPHAGIGWASGPEAEAAALQGRMFKRGWASGPEAEAVALRRRIAEARAGQDGSGAGWVKAARWRCRSQRMTAYMARPTTAENANIAPEKTMGGVGGSQAGRKDSVSCWL